MNIGDYVQMNVGKPLRGFVVDPPLRARTRLSRDVPCVWVLITKTPDGYFVGQTRPFAVHQVEVLSEGR